jgi:pimeloyl-ACP methyl ester carboxylesterase
MQKRYNHLGADLYYEDRGAGEVLVLLHGFAEDWQIWENIFSAIPDCRFILPDLPGSGLSQATGELSIESMGEAVLAILKHEGIQKAIIIGHSMGGYVTLAIVEKHPELIEAFGLFHSTAFPDSEEKKATRKKSIKFIETNATHAFLKQSTPALFSEEFKTNHPEVVEALIEKYKGFSPQVLVSYYEAMMKRPDRTEVLINSSKPVLFIIGKEDNAIPLEDSLKLCHLPSLSYIHILDKTGHMGMLEEPVRCIEIIKKFLKDVTVFANIDG